MSGAQPLVEHGSRSMRQSGRKLWHSPTACSVPATSPDGVEIATNSTISSSTRGATLVASAVRS